MQVGKHLHDGRAAGGIEIAGRLIGQDQAGIVDQGPGDGDPLLLAAGKLCGPVVGPVAQPNLFQDRAGLFPSSGSRDPRELHRE